ncbi:helix-turn-helix domain-containing protein [Neptuniibacter marinus]|uniref:helix-turn-helix domain-containing protein n=1 Tax=Neptuniibacter marinus TaxID=1806670 RepID=UPI003B5A1372
MIFKTPIDLGFHLKEQRKSQDFLQEDVAAYCQISDRTVRNIEKGTPGTKSRFVFNLIEELGVKLFISLKGGELRQRINSNQELGIFIRSIRKQQGIRQEDLSSIIGCQHSIVGKLERGIDSVSIGTVFAVMSELGLELTDGNK